MKAFIKDSGLAICLSPARKDEIEYIVLYPFDFDILFFYSLDHLLVQNHQQSRGSANASAIFNAVGV